MRIGLVIYGSLETLTGGYLYDRMVVEGLARLGHEVEVISLAGGPYLQPARPWFDVRPPAGGCWPAGSTFSCRTNSAIPPFSG